VLIATAIVEHVPLLEAISFVDFKLLVSAKAKLLSYKILELDIGSLNSLLLDLHNSLSTTAISL